MAQASAPETRTPKGELLLDRIFRGLSYVALLALTFLVGILITIGQIFPAPQIARAYEAGMALYRQQTQYQNVYSGDIWRRERRSDKGVTVYERGRAQDGLTLYTAGNAPAAYLIDMNGDVVHEWRRAFSTVWKAGAGGVQKPRPDEFVHFRNAHVYPNGDLVALYEGNGDTPYGYGVVKLDRNSEAIWFYPGRAHHQLNVGPGGKIYVLTHEIVDETLSGYGHLESPRLEDFLVILSPDGKELQKIRLASAIAESKYRHLLYTMSSFSLADPLHANAVDYIDQKAAVNFAFGKEGQVLLSFRELNAIAVIDPQTEAIVWATQGPWIGQHDPDIQPNGNILLFDNRANYAGPEGISRIIEFDPRTMEIVWQYKGTAEHPFASDIRGDQQRLANGNTLITEADGGRLVEVTPEGEIAWEFMNPVRGGPDNKMIPIMGWAQRLDSATFDSDFLQQGSDQAEADKSM
ncbi:arylsulfotransferase family protein [Chelativorans alearense]|uniref:arylsulfotransferase family protein n=1 Tax=Chelativorans alearense TaxID=2681495 RepID=UPI0013D183B1|nr:arylsulfotransferase family protein [Chelativorans alearense]